MSKPKVMDYDTDWDYIKEHELSFLVSGSGFVAGTDVRYSAVTSKKADNAPKEDPREGILKGLVQTAAYN